MDRGGPIAASACGQPCLSMLGRGRVAAARCGSSEVLGGASFAAGLDGHRRDAGSPRGDSLGDRGGWTGHVTVSGRVSTRSDCCPGARLPVPPRRGHADAAGAEAGVAAATNLGISAMPCRVAGGTIHCHCPGGWDRLVVLCARYCMDGRASLPGRTLAGVMGLSCLAASLAAAMDDQPPCHFRLARVAGRLSTPRALPPGGGRRLPNIPLAERTT